MSRVPSSPLGTSMKPDLAIEARRLLRSARRATLATQSSGQPYAALVTPAVLPDASIALLLSGLSEHTRHLRLEPRCALLFEGCATSRNPQTAARLTILGHAVPEHEATLKERWLRMHPYAAMYATLPDFTLWRVQPTGAHYVGGFARAARLTAADLRPDAASRTALAMAETSILSHCNDDHAAIFGDIARSLGENPASGWRMIAVDTDGFDMAREEVVRRVHWSEPVRNALQVRSELVRLAQEARVADRATPDH